MTGAMPQLTDTESKFFESRGRELAPSLLEGREGTAEVPAENGTNEEAREPAAAGAESEAAVKDVREGKFVPLQALQEERAEKKQLREELRQYREWQAQLAQRLQQVPVQPQQAAPDPQKQPLEYINHVLGSMQASTAELQQWRQQQELAARQRATAQHYSDWAGAQEREFTQAQPEYPEAYRYATETRDKELQALGYSDPAVRADIVRQNSAEIVRNALSQGKNPAELVWEYARARGFTPKGGRSANPTEAHAKIAAGLQAAGGKLNQGGAAGEAEMSAKDLSNISDPEEFERAWKKLFGKRR